MAALSKRESRLLAILLVISAMALADVAVVEPLIAGFAARAQQQQLLSAHYAANDRLIAAIPRLGRQAAQHERQLGDYMLSASDAAAAADILRNRLQAASNAVGGDFHGAVDIVQPPGPPRRVAMRVALRLSAAQLAQFLTAVENARPFVTIAALAVRAGDPSVTSQAATLDVNLEATISFRPAAAL